MTIRITAFQASAFQNSAFQIAEAIGAGSGDIPPWLLSVIANSKKRKKKKDERVTFDEVVAAIEHIRTRLNIRAIPQPRPMASLAGVETAARAREQAIAEAQFRADVAALDALIAEDWYEAA